MDNIALEVLHYNQRKFMNSCSSLIRTDTELTNLSVSYLAEFKFRIWGPGVCTQHEVLVTVLKHITVLDRKNTEYLN